MDRESGGSKLAAGRAIEVLLLALWFGLVAGFVEVTVLLFQQRILGHFIWLSRDFVWMVPMVHLLTFMAVGVALAAIAMLWRGVSPVSIAVPVLVFVAALSLLLIVPRIHFGALVLLAAGVAVQAWRSTSANPLRIADLVRRTTLPLFAILTLLGAAATGWRAWREHRTLAALPDAKAGSPSVLLIILDSVRAASLSLYGYGRPTAPALERWAQRGVVFERALATSSWTLPSHASLFTGRYPHELSTDWLTPLDDTHRTLAEIFRERGYQTAAFMANHYFTSYESGLARGFLHLEDYHRSRAQLRFSSNLWQAIEHARRGRDVAKRRNDRTLAEHLNANLLRWLGSADRQPFFVALNYYDSHQPYYAPPEVRRRFSSERRIVDRYDASIAYLDEQLNLLLTELERRSLLERMIVVVTSDHGELLGEHGLEEHGNSLYIPLLEVPLFVLPLAGAGRGIRVPTPVSLRDVPATLASLAEIWYGDSVPPFPGTSLERYWDGSCIPGRTPVNVILSEITAGIKTPPSEPVSRGPMKSLVMGEWHYILNGDGREELYNTTTDPTEERNAILSPAPRELIDRFRATLADMIGKGTKDAPSAEAKAGREIRQAFAPDGNDC